MKKTVLIEAPAKVNLYLKVFRKREDGYHDLVSLMQMVGLYDSLTFRAERSGIRLEQTDPSLPSDRSNLVIRAAEALQKSAFPDGATSPGVAIKLVKQIPIAAGLGGGSSDAAATLVGLNRLWSLGWSRRRLAELGATLGSDVPFFLYGPTAWVSGRGEAVEKSSPVAEGWVVLLNPGIAVSTAAVYQALSRKLGLTKNKPKISINRFLAQRPSATKIFRSPYNDLEKVTLGAHPELIRLKQELQARGGEAVLMSGSGPTLFARFESYAAAKQAAAAFEGRGSLRVWVARILKRSPI